MGGHAFPEFKTRRLDQNGFMTVATVCMDRLETAFPDFAKELEEVQKEMELRRQASEKFNGIIVREITGLEGRELGQFMQDFVKNSIEGEIGMTKIEWALKHSPDQIERAIKEWHKG